MKSALMTAHDYGLRVHMVVRETEAEAREYAGLSQSLMMKRGAKSESALLIAPLLGLHGKHVIVN